MSAPRHTPGPHVVHNQTDIFALVRSDGLAAPPNDGWQVADCGIHNPVTINGEKHTLSLDEQRANAKLFAQATTMQETLVWLRNVIGSDHPSDWTAGDIEEVERRINKAIQGAIE